MMLLTAYWEWISSLVVPSDMMMLTVRETWYQSVLHVTSVTNNTRCLNSCPPVPHICVSESGPHWSGNGLSPVSRQAIIWTNAGILIIRTLRTNFSEILSEKYELNSYICIQENAFEKVVCEMVTILSRRRWVNTAQCNYSVILYHV